MKQITLPIDIKSLEITSQFLDIQGNIIIEVKSKKTSTACHKCKKPATKRYGTAPVIQVRHLPILDAPVYLKIHPVRYQCDNCKDDPTTTESYDWCNKGSHITKGLEKYLMRNLIHSTVQDVSKKEKIGYKALTSTLDRQINQQVNWSEYKNLNTLGIDEISMKKGHQSYVTIVSSRSKNEDLSVIAVLEGRSKEVVEDFLNSIPLDLKKTVKSVCTDMYDGFVSAATNVFGKKVVVIDRYHVAKLYRKPIDQLRIVEMKRLKNELSSEEYSKLEGAMWALRKKYECLTDAEKTTLDLLYKYAPTLKKAHKYALQLTHIFNAHSNRKLGLAKLNRWISAVQKSDLKCFDKFIGTLEKYKPYISNYFKKRQNSGFVEGLNNKIKVAKRRCYGFFKTESLFQRLYLDLRGYQMIA
jgi:transposase